tara:strand:+ start:135 stop:341 length:207 start_codon:yes stop_codon:yes gene_type:complete
MSELSTSLPVSEGFLLSAGAMMVGIIAGCLSCVLKSRCSTIKCCGLELQRDVIPATDLNNVQVQMTHN